MKKNKIWIYIIIISVIVFYLINKKENKHFNKAGNMITQANDNRLSDKPIPSKLRWKE